MRIATNIGTESMRIGVRVTRSTKVGICANAHPSVPQTGEGAHGARTGVPVRVRVRRDNGTVALFQYLRDFDQSMYFSSVDPLMADSAKVHPVQQARPMSQHRALRCNTAHRVATRRTIRARHTMLQHGVPCRHTVHCGATRRTALQVHAARCNARWRSEQRSVASLRATCRVAAPLVASSANGPTVATRRTALQHGVLGSWLTAQTVAASRWAQLPQCLG